MYRSLSPGLWCLSLLITSSSVLSQVSVPTQHNDNFRTGLNSNELLLTPTTVNTNYFANLFSQAVDGPVYAQPLYVPNVSIANKGVHNVVFIATMHDSLYAFDADNNFGTVNSAPLWHASFVNPAASITPVSTADASAPYGDCQTFVGEIGIVGTPAIDTTTGTLFVVARTKEPSPTNNTVFIQVQRLHALDIASGNERSNSPVIITASANGTADGTNTVSFNPVRELQRAGLLLSGGVIYITWASYCDIPPYHGWVLAYDSHSLQQVGVFNDTPNGRDGGIWMAGAGLAGDTNGAVYSITGNGTFDTNGPPTDFGDSFVKLNLTTNLVLTDYFTPFDQATLDSGDVDLGSGGALVLPDSIGNTNHPHLLVGGGKDGRLFLLDRDNMGHFNPANDNQIVQEVQMRATLFGLPAFFQNRLYIQYVGQTLKAFAFTNGLLNAAPLSQTSDTISFRGATPSISANGVTNGIIWIISYVPGVIGAATLRAYDAENLSRRLFDSYTALPSNSPGQISYVKFVVPTIANGRVYVGTTNALGVFGLKSIILSAARDALSGTVQLHYLGPANDVVEASGDLAHWTDLGPGTATADGTFSFTDTQAASLSTRFYRLHQL